ncbi:MAG: GumC family protein [Chitinophagaceae bacterium]
MSEELSELLKQKKGSLTPREVFLKYIRFFPWVVISLALMLLLAYIKLRYSPPIYSVNSKLLVKNNNQNSNAGDKFEDIFMMQSGRTNMNDEIEVIKSRYMAKRVITKLNFQYQYFNKGQFRSSAIHQRDMPFLAFIDTIPDLTKSYGLQIVVSNQEEFSIGEKQIKHKFGEWFVDNNIKWFLRRTGRDFMPFSSKEFIINWVPLENLAGSLGGSLKVTKGDNFSNILSLGYETENTAIGTDVLNEYMSEYQHYSLEDKKQVAANTLRFIDEQMDTVKIDLSHMERTLQNFREQNKVIDPEGQAKAYLDNITESSKQITDQSVKLKVADQLYNYINDQKNPFRLVPTTLGIIEPTLVQQIGEYNRLVLERETTLLSTPRANPIVVTLEVGIAKLRNDMLDNLQNIRKTYSMAIGDFEKISLQSDRNVRTMPGVQKRLLEISRQQKILEELFSYLLQKRLETSIGSASTISNIKVVETAYYSNSPISPDKRSIYLLSIFIGLIIPAGIIFLLDYMNDRVQTKRDVQKVTDAPILGEVGHSTANQTMVVGKHNRKVVAEQFRMIRTNLQYILHDKKKMVIMVTSSFSGEGKSFVSTNIAGVIALTGKRTVILEFDIRKPKIIQGLGLNRSNGITNYIVGSCKLEELAVPVPVQENLFVIPCGPVPPNPGELLLDNKINEIFEFVRREFDVVIIDTAPVGLVSDAIALGKFADATVYIVRHDYTQKRQIQLIEDLYTQGKLPAMAIVINDIKIKLGYGGYYGYGGYGYGYGYGYGKKSSAYK